MDAFVKLVAAGPLFFVSAWLLMIFAGIRDPAPRRHLERARRRPVIGGIPGI